MNSKYQSGSVELHANGRAALNKVASQLASMAAQGNQIDVVGNTDNTPIGRELAGRYPSNWELAGARAALVVRHLQDAGVDPAKLEAINHRFHVSPWLYVTPDFQSVIHPNGFSNIANAAVVALEVSLAL